MIRKRMPDSSSRKKCDPGRLFLKFSLSNPFHKNSPRQSLWEPWGVEGGGGSDFFMLWVKLLKANGSLGGLPLKQSGDPKIKIQLRPNSVINGFTPPGVWKLGRCNPLSWAHADETPPHSITHGFKSAAIPGPDTAVTARFYSPPSGSQLWGWSLLRHLQSQQFKYK